MSHQIRGRHILGGIALAVLFSLPFDAMIVNATLTDIRMEKAFRAAAKRAADRAVASEVSAAPQPDTSALISRAQAEEKTEESSPTVGGDVVSNALRHIEAGATAMSGRVGVASASRTRVHAPERRGPQGVTAGETARSARSSSASALLGRVGRASMASAQGVRPERSPLELPVLGIRLKGGGRSSSEVYEVTSYSHGCVMPRSGRETHAQRAANGRWPIADVTVAADTTLHPFGTEVLIEGIGFRTVGDRGAAIKGRRLDLFVDSCREARAFGRRFLRVFPVPPATTREARGFDMETR